MTIDERIEALVKLQAKYAEEQAARNQEQAARDAQQAARNAEQAARDAQQAARNEAQAARNREQDERNKELDERAAIFRRELDERTANFRRDMDLLFGMQEAAERRTQEIDRNIAEVTRLQAQTERRLKHAIRLSVLDARRQRKRNAEFDKRHTEFEKGMEELRASLKAFIDNMNKGRNGHE